MSEQQVPQWSFMSHDERIALVGKEIFNWKPRHDPEKCDGEKFIVCAECGKPGHGNCFGDGEGAVDVLCGHSGISCWDDTKIPDYLSDWNYIGEMLQILRDRVERNEPFYSGQFLVDLQRLSEVGHPYWFIYLTPDLIAFCALRAIGVEISY